MGNRETFYIVIGIFDDETKLEKKKDNCEPLTVNPRICNILLPSKGVLGFSCSSWQKSTDRIDSTCRYYYLNHHRVNSIQIPWSWTEDTYPPCLFFIQAHFVTTDQRLCLVHPLY